MKQFDFSKLDKTKMYAAYFVPSKVKPFSAHWFIQLKAKQTISKYKLPRIKDTATHSAMFVYDNVRGWLIYESHFHTGVTKYPVSLIDTDSDIYAYQEWLDREEMDRLIGKPYGTLDILGFVSEYFGVKKSRWRNFDKGLFCTEYLFDCLRDKSKFATFTDNPSQLEPVMQQYLANTSGKEIIRL